ncbi:hypothetical protein SmJEL517_g00937 [Synchytrium microbalum]|uniref:K Homology domain-containing protein n=1 Tax=Synchytrium microbalum TaxID=1806994 RepID=A0A507CD20_9FUNG|nr:uncharacterized protein SmJEL517_g00937 [Synchytrium microbalum]TPX37069.1 hypothetical protein SmJEL517_g00937 [Synchytrium microbalum]
MAQDVPTDFVARLTGLTANPEPIRHASNANDGKPTTDSTTTGGTAAVEPAVNENTLKNAAPTPAAANTTTTEAESKGKEAATVADTDPSAPQKSHQPDVTLRALVTTREAGVIIGKEGKNVAAVREATGVRAGVSKVVPASTERILTVGGPLDAVAKAFSLMAKNLIDNPITPPQSGNPTETALIRLLVSHQVMGSVIGKGGARIKEIQEESGARIGVRKEMLPQSTERVVDISGLVDSIQIAVFYIGECIYTDSDRAAGTILYNPAPPRRPGTGHRYEEEDGQYYNSPRSAAFSSNRPPLGHSNHDNHSIDAPSTRRGERGDRPPRQDRPGGMAGASPYTSSRTNGAPSSSSNSRASRPPPPAAADEGEVVQKTTSIPADMVGCIIGRGGSVINHIRIQSGARVSISKTKDPETNERTFTIEGTQGALDKALTLLYKQLENEKARRLANATNAGGNEWNESSENATGETA